MANGNIQITAVDNELYVVAFQGTGSFQLAHVLSGNNQSVVVGITVATGSYTEPATLNGVTTPLANNYTVTIPAGVYLVLAVGVNWGGAAGFSASVNGTPLDAAVSSGVGVVWTPGPVSMTVS